MSWKVGQFSMLENPKNFFRDYASRFIKKTTSVITGILGFLIPVIFELVFPDLLNIYIYLIIIGTSLFVSGYLVYVDVVNEHLIAIRRYEEDLSKLRKELQEVNLSQPNIIVGLQKNGKLYVNKQSFYLRPLPSKPQIEDLISEKRTELLAKFKNVGQNPVSEKIKMPGILGETIASFTRSSQNYEKRVEKYLEEYKEYLVDYYDFSIFENRFQVIKPVIENNSPLLATKVIIECVLPEDMLFPSSSINKMMDIAKMTKSSELRPPSPPEEPEIFEIQEFSTANWVSKRQKNRMPIPSGLKVIDREGKRVLIFELDAVIQNRSLHLAQIPVWFGNIVSPTTWEIPVKIWAAELRSPIESILEIVIYIANEK